MKSCYCFAFLLCFLFATVHAQQQTVSIGTQDTKHHAVLFLHSAEANQGLIVPIVSNRNTMMAGAATEAGMIIFESATKTLYYNNGTEWIPVANTGPGVESDGFVGNEIVDITDSRSGLEVSGNGTSTAKTISLKRGEIEGQILKWSETNGWYLSTDEAGSAPQTDDVSIGFVDGKLTILPFGVSASNVATTTQNESVQDALDDLRNDVDSKDANATNELQDLTISATSTTAPKTFTLTNTNAPGNGVIIKEGTNVNLSISDNELTINATSAAGGIQQADQPAAGEISGSYADGFTINNGAVTLEKLATDATNVDKVFTTDASGVPTFEDKASFIAGSVTADDVSVTPTGTLSSSTTQSALEELQTEIDDVSTNKVTNASNQGGGTGSIFNQKSGTDLQFNTLQGTSKLSITTDNTNQIVNLDVNDAGLSIATTQLTGTINDGQLGSNISVDKLAPSSTEGQVLQTSGGVVSWQTIANVDPDATTQDGILIGNGTTTSGLSTNTAGQFLRRNSANTGYEFASTLPLEQGGTGATSAANARTNLGLGVLSTSNEVGSAEITDGTITNTDVSSTAAIDGSKILPSFGNQNVSTTGTLSAGASTLSSLNVSGSTTLNSIGYTWPAAQGSANTVLTNNGSGTLSWTTNAGMTNPLTTTGDLVYGVGSTPTRLPGAAGFLKSTGAAAPSWSSIDLSTTDVSGTLPISRGGTGATTVATALTSLGALSTSLNSGRVFVGNGSNVATGVTLSGDISSVSSGGVVTIANDAITSAKIANGTIANADIADVDASKITTGTLGVSRGGTGLTTFSTGLLYASDATTLTNLANGTNGQVLTMGASSPAWSTIATPLATANVIPKGDGTGQVASNLIDDDGNIGIGIMPLSLFHAHGSSASTFRLTNTTTGATASDGLEVDMGGSNAKIMNLEGGVLILGSATNEVVQITSGGNVGINNNNPSSMLDVGGAIEFNGALLPNNLAGTSGQVLTSQGTGAAPIWSTLSGWSTSGNNGTNSSTNFIGTTDNVALRFKTNNMNSGLIDPLNSNNFFGYLAGNLTTGVQNVAVGTNALLTNTSGTGNVGIGTGALQTNTTGSNNLAIGNFADVGTGGLNNATAIGYNAVAAESNTMILGGTGADAVKVGIGTTSPKLDIQLGNDFGFINDNANSQSLMVRGIYSDGTNVRFLSSSAASAVVLAPERVAFFAFPAGTADGIVGSPSIGINIRETGMGINVNTPAEIFDVNGPTMLRQISSPATTTDRLYNVGGSLYWNGNNISAGSGWAFGGNSGTVDGAPGTGTNYLGTTDNVPLNFLVNNQRAGRIDASNNVFLGLQSGNVNTGTGNTAVGASALLFNSSGFSNTALGFNSLRNNTNGNLNVAIGVDAAIANTTGNYNTSLGAESAYNNTSGNTNVAIGYQSLRTNVAGSGSTAIGYGAMSNANNSGSSFTSQNVAVGYEAYRGSATASSNTGNQNTAIGFQSLYNNSLGGGNTALGNRTLAENTIGSNNVALGNAALVNNINGGNNVGIGSSSLLQNQSGHSNVAIGNSSLSSGTSTEYSVAIGSEAAQSTNIGTNNTVVGAQTLYQNTQGSNNVTLGFQTMYSNVAGSNATAIGTGAMRYSNSAGTAFDSENVAVGYMALRGSTTVSANSGNYNTALGYQTLLENTSGSFNVAVGRNALPLNTAGSSNAALGHQALINNTTGNSNTAIGDAALSSNITGTNNTAIGAEADVSAVNLTNATAIGYNAKVATSNSLVLGGTGVEAVKVGIGTSSPTETIDAVGNVKFSGALMPGNAAGSAGQVLTSAGHHPLQNWI